MSARRKTKSQKQFMKMLQGRQREWWSGLSTAARYGEILKRSASGRLRVLSA